MSSARPGPVVASQALYSRSRTPSLRPPTRTNWTPNTYAWWPMLGIGPKRLGVREPVALKARQRCGRTACNRPAAPCILRHSFRGLTSRATRQFPGRHRPSVLPHRRSLRDRGRDADAGNRGQAQGDHDASRRAVHLQGVVRQGESFLGEELSRSGHRRRPQGACGRARQDRRARAHRRARGHAVRGSRERGRRHADAGVPARARPTSS